MTGRKNPNLFSDIIAARQQEATAEEVQSEQPAAPSSQEITKNERTSTSKRSNPDYSAVTVYIPTETYARAQFEMTRKGRKREMSELFTELLDEWLKKQS